MSPRTFCLDFHRVFRRCTKLSTVLERWPREADMLIVFNKMSNLSCSPEAPGTVPRPPKCRNCVPLSVCKWVMHIPCCIWIHQSAQTIDSWDIWSTIWCVRRPVNKHTPRIAQLLIRDLEFCAALTVYGPKISIDSLEKGASRAILWWEGCVLCSVWPVRLHLKHEFPIILPTFFWELVMKMPWSWFCR